MADAAALPLPLAQDRETWGFVERSELGADGACDLVYRVPVGMQAGPQLPSDLAQALPLLLHEFDRQEGLAPVLASFNEQSHNGDRRGPTSKTVLRRVIPRLVTYRYVESKQVREFVFEGHRPSSVHVLARVFETDFRFRLEDLSHFATHGEHLLGVLEAVGLPFALDPEGILYCPALDSPFPFKFAVVGSLEEENRKTYVKVLKQLLRKTESDEVFRSRNFQEMMRGFQKFGPASATPQFQEVELKIWRLLSYLAARLRVKAGRMTDTKDAGQVRQFLAELGHVHTALDDLVHLPSSLAAFYRSRFDLELSGLYEHVLPELDAIAARIDCDMDRARSIEEVAQLVSEFRRLGSASPLESLESKDIEIKQAYGDVAVPKLESGWVRSYTEKIFTGAQRFDTRRYQAESDQGESLGEEDLTLDVDLNFSFGLGGGDEEAGIDVEGLEASEDTGASSAADEEEEWELSDLDMDWG